MNKEQMTEVSFEELWAKLSGSTNFGQDEIIEMLSLQDNAGKDFCIYHRNSAFCVPLHKIREFFTRHEKPIPPMTQDQELKYLREKVQKLEDEAKAHMGQINLAKPAPDETEVLTSPEEPEEDTKVAEEVPVAKEKVIPPKRDEAIPPPHEREKRSLKEVRSDLAKELKDTKLPKEKVTGSAVPSGVKDREAEVDSLLKKK